MANISDRESEHERLRVRYFLKEGGEFKDFVGKAYFGHRCEGPPGLTLAHACLTFTCVVSFVYHHVYATGGSQAAVLDEAMGTAVCSQTPLPSFDSSAIPFHDHVPLPLTTIRCAEVPLRPHGRHG